MAVLVQPLLEPRAGGVLFGVDPVTGRSDRRVIAAVSGGPDALVSGTVSGARYELTESGHVKDSTAADDDPVRIHHRDLRRIKELGDRAATVFERTAGRRMGVGHGRHGLVAAEPPGDDGDRGHPRGPRARPGPGGRDLPRSAQPARAGPLGRAAAPGDPPGVPDPRRGLSPAARPVPVGRRRRRAGRGGPRSLRSRGEVAVVPGRRAARVRCALHGGSAGCAPRSRPSVPTWSRTRTRRCSTSRTRPR